MNSRRKFLILYFTMVCTFILHILLNEQLALKAKFIYDHRLAVMTIISGVIDIAYYIIIYLVFIAISKIERVGLLLETVFLGIPALFLLVTSVIMTNPFLWIFKNQNDCIPFGAMILCMMLYRLFNKK